MSTPTLDTYLNLVDHGQQFTSVADLSDPLEPLILLLTQAEQDTYLPFESPWRLDVGICRYLNDQHGYSPAGGWQALAGLAAGCEILVARREGFYPGISLDDLSDWPAYYARKRLVEAFTQNLVPPSTAASLFLVMGIHPAWGLRLAQNLNSRQKKEMNTLPYGPDHINDKSTAPDGVFNDPLALLEHYIFGTIASTICVLRHLNNELIYPISALNHLLKEIWENARNQIAAHIRSNFYTLQPPILMDSPLSDISSENSGRACSITTNEIIDNVLIPACAIRRFDNNTFCVNSSALDNISVFGIDDNSHERFLQSFLCNGVNPRFAC